MRKAVAGRSWPRPHLPLSSSRRPRNEPRHSLGGRTGMPSGQPLRSGSDQSRSGLLPTTAGSTLPSPEPTLWAPGSLREVPAPLLPPLPRTEVGSRRPPTPSTTGFRWLRFPAPGPATGRTPKCRGKRSPGPSALIDDSKHLPGLETDVNGIGVFAVGPFRLQRR